MARNIPRTVSGDLPEDVSMEILSKLPVKSLMRFKCISKSMYALITNPRFIKKHLTSPNPHRGAILRRGDGLDRLRVSPFSNKPIEPKPPRLSTLSNETLELSGDVDLSQLFQDEVTGLRMLGPCNGILCVAANLTMKDGDLKPDYEIVLWNPATRESKMLPPINMPTSTFTSNFGFGFDPKTDDYKVVRILSFDSHREVVVYNLSTNSWRAIDSSPNPSHSIRLPRFPSCLNGVLYWWAIEDPYNEERRHLISFDMSNEVFQELLPPPTQGIRFEDIAVINDSLTLMLPGCNLFEEWIEIWVLNEFGIERTWKPKFAILLPNYWGLIQLREDGWAVLADKDDCLVLHNPTTEERRNLQISEAGFSQLVTYTESLILLNGPGNVLEQQATP
jgi:F-box interacting protein